jgi:SAM-dependent methyltransferase
MTLAAALTAAEAAIYESLVVTRYMQAFGEPAVSMLIRHEPAIVAHVPCRTGYPADRLAHRLTGCVVSGVDPSAAAIELARTKASLIGGLRAEYRLADRLPTPLASNAYTHCLSLHPLGPRGDYGELFAELYRLLTPGGQAVVSLPLRGSFPEIYDMLREYALRHDEPQFGEAVDAAAVGRPNPETLVDQIERAGLCEIDVGVELVAITFDHGRDFLEDPITRLVVGPDIVASLPVEGSFEPALAYASDAISKYWSEIPFELTVNIGSVSCRKL